MRALYFENGSASVRSLAALPRPEAWANIRVLFSGVCNTDLELLQGYYGFSGVPGHEFVGEVVETDNRGWLGRKVVGEINVGCHALGRPRSEWCDLCLRGWPRHCRVRKVLGIVDLRGAHADTVLLPLLNLHRISDDIAPMDAVFVEPLAAACEILEQVRVTDADRVAILGDGKLGLLIAQVIATAQPRELLIVGHHADKLRLASTWGLSTRLAGTSKQDVLPSKEFDLVIDATGSAAGMTEAIRLCRPRGTVVLKSTVHDRVQIDTAPVIVDEITIVGSRCGPFDRAIDLLASKQIRVHEMIHDCVPLVQATRALDRARQPGVLKVILQP